jgi:hypothetical protein
MGSPSPCANSVASNAHSSSWTGCKALNCVGERTDLNKGEARNALARAVFFYRLGEIRDRSFEQQQYRPSGLTLATAAIALWNTDLVRFLKLPLQGYDQIDE